MLASRSVPIATTARSNSWTESWRRASSSVESASTTWVSVAGERLHGLGVGVDAEHLGVRGSISSRAREVPKRPRPMTTTPVGQVF